MTRGRPVSSTAVHPRSAHPLVTTGPRHGFRLVAGIAKPWRSWRHTTPTMVTPARAARRAAANTGLNPGPHTRPRTHVHTCVEPPARACLLESVDLTRSASCPARTHARAWSDGRGRRRRTATLPRSGRIGALLLLPPPGRLRPRGPVRVRDRPIGCHHPRISPGRFESRVGGM